MSAQLAGDGMPLNRFTAYLALAAGVTVSIHAPTLPDLAAVVSRLQSAVNDPVPAPTPLQAVVGNAPASTATPASAPPAASGSAPAGEAGNAAAASPAPVAPAASPASSPVPATYDDVKARVLALAKKDKPSAVKLLQEFGVDNAQKLKPEQYAGFCVRGDQLLGVAA